MPLRARALAWALLLASLSAACTPFGIIRGARRQVTNPRAAGLIKALIKVAGGK